MKKAISLMLAMICAFTFMFVCPVTFKAEAASYFLGSGTESDPYKITTKNDLFLLSTLVNDDSTSVDYYDKCYIQTKDIDLEGEKFTPIGTREESGGRGFSGLYNGNNNNIYDFYVERDWNFNGLFGWIYGGAVENVTIYGEINCPNANNCGGITGDIGSGGARYIKNCAFIGNITGKNLVGGIAGASWISCTIENCYFNGKIALTGDGGYAGGIIGVINNGWEDTTGSSTIRNCYAVSKVKGICNGGVIGLFTKNNENSTSLIENNYYLETMASSGITGDYTDGCSPLNKNEMKSLDNMLGNPFVHNDVEQFNDGYPIFEWQLDDAENSIPVVIPFAGTGSKFDPYQIETAEDLFMLSEAVNDDTTGDYFRRCYYIQTKDIDLNNEFFTPIGLNSDFIGSYDGNYHKISNLKISISKSSCGLFGSVSESGTVCRLSVTGSVTSTGSNVGGIVGLLTDNALMTACDYHGSVDGVENVGALVGAVKNGVAVEACYSDASVNGQSAVGGLIGCVQSDNNSSVIKQLYFSGDVSSDDTQQGAVLGVNNDKSLEISSIYFLSSICDGNAINSEPATGCTKLSSTALKACADMLGTPFTSNQSTLYGGYPVFEWQSTPYQFKGSGTESDPYKISTRTDLENMRVLINSSYFNQIYGAAHYVQTADIDLGDELWTPIASFESGQTFRGVYDGGCHYINGLNVNLNLESTGLFGITDGARIFDIVVYGSVIGAEKYSGGIVGKAMNNTEVECCGFIGSITCESSAGGIVGNIVNNCIISDCYHNGTVSSNGYAGGIAGTISFDDNIDGASVMIQNCYQANGAVSGETYSGCILGNCDIKSDSSNTVSILNCFSTTDADAVTNQANATKDNTLLVTRSMLKKASEDLGNCFTDNTSTTLNDGYPVFTWQIKSDVVGDVNNDGVFNVSDVVMMQKWLLCVGQLTTWENGDLCEDNQLNAFDLCLMKQKLIND